jgi:hypothetical protein
MLMKGRYVQNLVIGILVIIWCLVLGIWCLCPILF